MSGQDTGEGDILAIHGRCGLDAGDGVGRQVKVIRVLGSNSVEVSVARKDGIFGRKRVYALHHLDPVAKAA